MLEPEDDSPLLTTSQILRTIDNHAEELALILLPGVQFYTGQYFDIKTITAHAHAHDIMIGWDCAHAVGNLDLKLHDWGVDFAVWCSYKYLNAGPGGMAGIFVHEDHGKVDMDSTTVKYKPRLSGWWGDDKSGRFRMTNSKAYTKKHCRRMKTDQTFQISFHDPARRDLSYPILPPSISRLWSPHYRYSARLIWRQSVPSR